MTGPVELDDAVKQLCHERHRAWEDYRNRSLASLPSCESPEETFQRKVGIEVARQRWENVNERYERAVKGHAERVLWPEQR